MPRRSREQSPTGIYHIIMRGINRQSIFEEDEDKQKFIEIILRYREKTGYRIFAYCLMDNHIHLLLQEQREPISNAMKRICSSYVLWFNKKYDRCGHLFQERFKSEPVNNDRYFLTVLRYIHHNPIKANLAKDLSDYKWSSYKEYKKSSHIVDREYALSLFSATLDESLKKFVEFSQGESTESCLDVEDHRPNMTDEKLKEIIRENFSIEAIRIANEENARQKEILKKLKQIKGVSIRQIARTTGISQTSVWRA